MAEGSSFGWGDIAKLGTDYLYKYADAKLNKYQRPQVDVIPRGGYAYAGSQGWHPPMLLPPAAPAPAAPAPVNVVSPVIEARNAKPPMWKNPMFIAGGVVVVGLLIVLLKR